MKKSILFFLTILIATSCSINYNTEIVDINTLELENTSWKLKKEIYTFQNGTTEIYAVNPNNNTGNEYYFIWNFYELPIIIIENSPYTYDQNVLWSENNSLLSITIQTNPTLIQNNFEIIELTETFMKVKFTNHNVVSTLHGIATEVFYEFDKI